MNLEPRAEAPPPAVGSKFKVQGSRIKGSPGHLPQQPSVLYGALLWRAGLLAARTLPLHGTTALAQRCASLYALACPRRREVVVRNLLPAAESRAHAEMLAAELFRQFARKLIDLWRFEAGLPVAHLFRNLTGWEHFLAAQRSGRGVLLVTPHLGNWEFGAPVVTRHGYKLHVITLVEPGRGLTRLRQSARARWGIETLVIGRDPFAFVEIIRRLEDGATIALLVDRPPKASAMEVQLFGRPFDASIAAAELARASGCEILPVCLPRVQGGYAAHILPAIQYERATLRDRQARQQLTQAIIGVFEPAIREHLDQWYHFVPVWRE